MLGGPTQTTLKILFAQSGNRCGAPGCEHPIVAEETPFDGPAVIGQVAHIVARSDGGPRGDPGFPREQLHAEANLILLCAHHHALVDAHELTYGVEELRRWKQLQRTRRTTRVAISRAVPVPRQLPPLEGPFVNRTREVAKLDALLRDATPGASAVAVLTGMHGVGKSATGQYWAHVNSDRFVDGQLYVNVGELRHEGGVDVGDLLGVLLRALGSRDDVIPQSLAERTALFRSATAGKRVLLMLDDVDHAAQVRPLMPSASESVVLVTSRTPLEELVRDGAKLIRVRPLEQAGARDVLRLAMGDDDERVEAEPSAVEQLVEICAGLPVALRICGARLAIEDGRPIGSLVRDLTDETRRLERLAIGSDDSVEAVFTDAYRSLGERAGLLYRRLGLHPGPSFEPAVAAAAAGLPLGETTELLAQLARVNLIEDLGERMRFHDLLRIHARNTAQTHEPEAEREQAIRRIAALYLGALQRMDHAIIPERLRLSDGPPPAGEGEPAFASTAQALGWFEAERASLVPVLRAVAARRWDAIAWRMGEALWLAYHNRKHYGEAIEVYDLAASAAQRLGEDAAESRMRAQLARAYIDLGDHRRAEAELRAAGELAERAGHAQLRASVVEFVGVLEAARGDYPEAIAAFERALEVAEALGSGRGMAIQEYHLGRVLVLAGSPADAVPHLLHAVELIDAASDGLTLGRALLHLGEARRALGDRAAASAALEAAIETMQRVDAPYYEAMARERLGLVERESGRPAEAREQLRGALEIYAALGSPRANDVKLLLAEEP